LPSPAVHVDNNHQMIVNFPLVTPAMSFLTALTHQTKPLRRLRFSHSPSVLQPIESGNPLPLMPMRSLLKNVSWRGKQDSLPSTQKRFSTTDLGTHPEVAEKVLHLSSLV